MHQSRRTYVPLFPPTARKYIFQSHQSPSGPVYTKKTPQVFWIHKTVWFEHEDTFISKLPGEKGYLVRIPSRTDLRRYIVYQSRLPPCLAANKNLTMTTSTSGMHLSRRTYVPLFIQTVKYIYFSPTSPLPVLSTPEKHYKLFGFTKTVWYWTWKHISIPGEKGYAYHPERILDDILSTIHEFASCLAANFTMMTST